MTAARASSQRGLTMLEFTLAALVVALLVAFAADRIFRVRMAVERVAIEHQVARMREALAVRFSELIVQGRREEIPRLLGANPLEGAAEPVEHAGSRRLPPAGEREPGQWYFDAAIGNVVYVPRYPEALAWPQGEPRLLRWQVRPDWVDVDDDGEYTPATDRVHGLDLVRLDDARWR